MEEEEEEAARPVKDNVGIGYREQLFLLFNSDTVTASSFYRMHFGSPDEDYKKFFSFQEKARKGKKLKLFGRNYYSYRELERNFL